MQPFDFPATTRVVFGLHTLDQLGTLARDLKGTRVLLVTDHGLLQTGFVERALQSLRKEGIEPFVFADVDENPSTRHVDAAVEFAKQQGPIDLLIGFGGGSPMDVAKGVNFLLTNGGKMEDYWGVDKATHAMLPSIGIPTTAGTGSEAQSFALIAQEGTHRKMACGDKKARFRTVILDPYVTTTAPKHVTAVSGIDAIGHAIETYVTLKRNPLSEKYSREAWRLLEGNFEAVLREPQNIDARANMLLGAHYAGWAIEHSMLGAAHACANPLTEHYGITHGIAVGLMLPAVIRFNSFAVQQAYQELSPDLVGRILELQKAAGLPRSLPECGVEQSALPQLAKEAADQWTGKFNPRPVSETEFLQLYEAAYLNVE